VYLYCCRYIHIFTYIYIYLWTCADRDVFGVNVAYTCMKSACTFISIYKCIHTHLHIHIYLCVYIHTYIYMYVYIYVYMQQPVDEDIV